MTNQRRDTNCHREVGGKKDESERFDIRVEHITDMLLRKQIAAYGTDHQMVLTVMRR